jgi:hypothetical protein
VQQMPGRDAYLDGLLVSPLAGKIVRAEQPVQIDGKLAAILAADLVGCSRLAGSDEERTLARLRGLRSDLIDPAIAAHHGRVVKRTLWLKRHGLNISCVPRRLGDRCHKKEPQAVYAPGVH